MLKIMFGVIMSIIATTSTFADLGTKFREEADVLREEGKSLKAIDLYNQAIVNLQEAKEYANIIPALTGRLLSWKHLFYKTQDKIYAIFVKKEAETIMDFAKAYNLMDRLYLFHFLNGTAASLLNEYDLAEKEFGQAILLYPFEHAQKGDWIAHQGEAMYQNGKKEEGQERILEGVALIQTRSSDIDSFEYNVWVSGAYLRLAKLLKVDNPKTSQEFYNMAKEIIDKDDRLVIRKQQLDAF